MDVLVAIILILLVAWAIGFFAFNVGSLIHILLAVAIVIIIVRLLQGRRVL